MNTADKDASLISQQETWSLQSLGEISAIRKEKTTASAGVPCVELEHIEPGTGRLLGWDKSGTQESIKTAFKKGDVLFGKLRPYLKKYAIAPEDGICTTEILAIYPKETIDEKFLFFLIQSDDIFSTVEQISYGTKMPRVNWTDLSDITVNIPPLPEQQKIAAILTAVDDKLDVIARQIEATQTLKRGLMQTLFSRGVGTQDASGRWVPHTEFKDSELGEIPATWRQTTLGEICGGNLQTGPFGSQLHADEYTNDGISVLMPRDLINFRANLSTAAKIPQSRANELERHYLSCGDILFSRRGDVTRFALIDEKSAGAICGTGCLKAKPSKDHNSLFISYLLQLNPVGAWLEQNAVGQTMPNMNTAILSSLPLVVPCERRDQDEIANTLKHLDQKISISREKGKYYQTLKRGLMQKLLTGAWRVKVDAEATAAPAA